MGTLKAEVQKLRYIAVAGAGCTVDAMTLKELTLAWLQAHHRLTRVQREMLEYATRPVGPVKDGWFRLWPKAMSSRTLEVLRRDLGFLEEKTGPKKYEKGGKGRRRGTLYSADLFWRITPAGKAALAR